MDFGFDTLMVHAGHSPDSDTLSVSPPIYQTNAYKFKSTAHAKSLFELKEAGNIYTRITNPTNAVLEDRMAALDGGVGALAFSSGHAAIFNTIVCLCSAGDEVVSSRNIYGGAINMLNHSLGRLGIKVNFVDPDDFSAWESAVNDNTKLLFTEIIGNPHANVADLSKIADIAHKHEIPFMADSTFTTPYLCKPLDFGADFVIHSATKFLSGHGNVMAGVIVDGGRFNFKGNKRFPLFNEADPSYHGVVFADLGSSAFILRLRALVMRDLGSCLSPFNSFIVLQGIETLSLRMERHCSNALAVAKYLQNNPAVSKVNYPMLDGDKYNTVAKKYIPKGAGSVFTFELKGGKAAGEKFMDSLELIQIVANVGDVRSLVIHPATTTHSQLSPQQLADVGITEDTVRLSIGIETIDDIITDIESALKKLQ